MSFRRLQGASSIDTGNEVDFVWDAEQVTTEGRPGPQPSYSETFHMSIATDPWHSPGVFSPALCPKCLYQQLGHAHALNLAEQPHHPESRQMPRATYPDPACSLIPFECTPCCQSAWILPSFRSRRSREPEEVYAVESGLLGISGRYVARAMTILSTAVVCES